MPFALQKLVAPQNKRQGTCEADASRRLEFRNDFARKFWRQYPAGQLRPTYAVEILWSNCAEFADGDRHPIAKVALALIREDSAVDCDVQFAMTKVHRLLNAPANEWYMINITNQQQRERPPPVVA